MEKSKLYNPSGLRFEDGSKECGDCKTKDNIIQFEKQKTIKGLPVVEVAFLCKSCATKRDLIDHSIEVKKDNRPWWMDDKNLCVHCGSLNYEKTTCLSGRKQPHTKSCIDYN